MKTVFVQTILSGRASLKVGEESCVLTVPGKAPEGRRTPKPGGNSVAPLLALASWSAPALRRFRDQPHARKSSPAFNHPKSLPGHAHFPRAALRSSLRMPHGRRHETQGSAGERTSARTARRGRPGRLEPRGIDRDPAPHRVERRERRGNWPAVNPKIWFVARNRAGDRG